MAEAELKHKLILFIHVVGHGLAQTWDIRKTVEFLAGKK